MFIWYKSDLMKFLQDLDEIVKKRKHFFDKQSHFLFLESICFKRILLKSNEN